MMILKVTKKQNLTLSSDHIFSNLFLELILAFSKLAIFHSISIRTSLRKIVRKITT